MRNSSASKPYPEIILTAVILGTYVFSLCPTLYLIDSGELAVASHTLGIAHPTGYPLYTMISYFFAHLPGEAIFNLNLLSALFCAAAACIVMLTALKATGSRSLAVLAACLFAFAPMIWRIAVVNEVYSLTALFIVLIVSIALNLRSRRGFYFLMYLIGMAFTNHVIVFAAALPVFLYTIIRHKIKFRLVMSGLVFSALGISLYYYLIGRTIGGAHIAWGDTYNLPRLIWHITGRQYQVWMFSLPIKEIVENFGRGMVMLFRNMFWIFLLPVFIGYHRLFTTDKLRFSLLLVIPLLNIAYTINYSIPDVESYYLPTLVSFVTVIIIGLSHFSKWLKWYLVVPLAFLIVVFNYRSCSQRGNYFGLEFADAHLEQLPTGSLLLCTYWDIYSPIMYLRQVKNQRKDVIVIDKELLRRTWYIKYLNKEYPEFYAQVKNQVDLFLVELEKFEHQKFYDPLVIQTRYVVMLEAFISAREDRAFVAMPFPDRDLQSVLPQYHRLPRGLNYQIMASESDYSGIDYGRVNISRPGNINDERLDFNAVYVDQMIRNNIAYHRSAGNFLLLKQAEEWLIRYRGN